jgi:hypothetical protein
VAVVTADRAWEGRVADVVRQWVADVSDAPARRRDAGRRFPVLVGPVRRLVPSHRPSMTDLQALLVPDICGGGRGGPGTELVRALARVGGASAIPTVRLIGAASRTHRPLHPLGMYA